MKQNTSKWKSLDEGLEHMIFDVLLATPGRALAVLLLAAYLASQMMGPAIAPTKDSVQVADSKVDFKTSDMVKRYLRDRPWLDEIPMNPTPDNPCHAYFFTGDERQGVYITFLSRYRQEIELFYYKLRGTDQIEIYLPDSKKKAVGKIDISETSNGQFDIKLALGNDPKVGGPADYYSFKQWDKGLSPSALANKLFSETAK
jgi:hypothetical protein